VVRALISAVLVRAIFAQSRSPGPVTQRLEVPPQAADVTLGGRPWRAIAGNATLALITAGAAFWLWPVRQLVEPALPLLVEMRSSWPVERVNMSISGSVLTIAPAAVRPATPALGPPCSSLGTATGTNSQGSSTMPETYEDQVDACADFTILLPNSAGPTVEPDRRRTTTEITGMAYDVENGSELPASGIRSNWLDAISFAGSNPVALLPPIHVVVAPVKRVSNGRDTYVSLPVVSGLPDGTQVTVVTPRLGLEGLDWGTGVVVANRAKSVLWRYQTSIEPLVAHGVDPEVVAADQRNTFLAGVLAGISGGFLVAAGQIAVSDFSRRRQSSS